MADAWRMNSIFRPIDLFLPTISPSTLRIFRMRMVPDTSSETGVLASGRTAGVDRTEASQVRFASGAMERENGMPSKRQYGSSKLFQPYRVVGQVASDVPFCVLALDQTLHLVVAIGKAFQIFDVRSLPIISVVYH